MPHHNFPLSAKGLDQHSLPTPANALFREISSAAVDVELARLARSWSLGVIEKKVGSFKQADSPRGARKKSFHALRAGSRLQEGHAARIQDAFPRSNVYLWWLHPIGAILCNPKLGADDLLAYLRRLPPGRTRSRIWMALYLPLGSIHSETLAPWTPELVVALRTIGTPVALFALLARLRIEQLSGSFFLGVDAATAAWELLAKSISRSRHLLISKDCLIVAMDYFLSWAPFADARLWESFVAGRDLSCSGAVDACCHRAWANDNSIPAEIKLARKARLIDVFPDNPSPGTWSGNVFWGMRHPAPARFDDAPEPPVSGDERR